MNLKPLYTSPALFGVKETEITDMAGNRYQSFTGCCNCTGHGSSRA